VLLGFSTTGKSTILKYFRKGYADAIETVDSDGEISKEDGSHIYNVFLRFVDRGNTHLAIEEIERREHLFLEKAGPGTKPLLLAAGPFLPIRELEWSAFVERVRPICFYLQKTPEGVLKGLRERRARHLLCKQLANRPGFGCWDRGVTTEFRNGQWVEIKDPERALQNIRDNMREMVRRYRAVPRLV
jgi:shikimate kinase